MTAADASNPFIKYLNETSSKGLQMLLQAKIKGMQERQKIDNLSKILGTPVSRSSDSPQEDTSIDLIETDTPDYSDTQIAAVSQLDPNLARILQSQKKASEQSQASRFKETKETRKEVLSQAKAAQENNMRLDRMAELNREGKLVKPVYNEMLKKFRIDIGALKNPQSEEFDKLSQDMLRNIREVFGARITNLEVQNFLRTIPTLSNSKEGRERIIKNLKVLNEGAEARATALKDILKQNKGIPPYDLAEQIDERISPKLEEISAKFMEAPVQNSISEGTRAKGPKGEIIIFKNGKWVKS